MSGGKLEAKAAFCFWAFEFPLFDDGIEETPFLVETQESTGYDAQQLLFAVYLLVACTVVVAVGSVIVTGVEELLRRSLLHTKHRYGKVW